MAPSLWPTRVNESHVFNGGEQSQSRDTAMEAFFQESIFNSGRGKLWKVSLSLFALSSPSNPDLQADSNEIPAIFTLRSAEWGPRPRQGCPLVLCFGTVAY